MADNMPLERTSVTPAKRNKPGKYVSSFQKSMIVNLYKEHVEQGSTMKYRDMLAKLSKASGIGTRTICNTLSEYRRTGTVSTVLKKRKTKCVFDKIDDLDKQGIRRIIYSFWLRHELPTLDSILQAINNDYLLPNFSRSSLHRLLLKMQFVYTLKKRHNILTENEDIINCRRNYLCDIRNFRKQNKTIYYLDETWVNFRDCSEVVWDSKPVKKERGKCENGKVDPVNSTCVSKRLIVLHIGSEKGFLENGLLCFEPKENTMDFHDVMDGDSFREWFEKIVPTLEPNSVIVMDNAPHHSVQEKSIIPTRCWRKKDILTWLESRGETFERPMLIGQLLVRAKQLEDRLISYVIDEIARKAGHIVLRLPDHHSEFNPIDSAWAMVKEYIKQNNITSKTDVKQLLSTCVDRVTSQDWSCFIKDTIEEENKIWDVDDIMDDIIDSVEPSEKTVIETKTVL